MALIVRNASASIENQVTVYELYNAMRERQERHVETFAIVLDRVYARIRKYAEVNRLDCVYEVPEFVVGRPLYDVSRCVKHVLNHLELNGFRVRYFFPRFLHISWDVSQKQESQQATVGAEPGAVSPTPLATHAPEARLPLRPKFRSITDFRPSSRLGLGRW